MLYKNPNRKSDQQMKRLEELVNKVRQLPPARQQQVFNFVEFLAQRHEDNQESEPDGSEIDTSDIPELDDAFFERAEFRRLQRRRGEKGKVDKPRAPCKNSSF